MASPSAPSSSLTRGRRSPAAAPSRSTSRRKSRTAGISSSLPAVVADLQHVLGPVPEGLAHHARGRGPSTSKHRAADQIGDVELARRQRRQRPRAGTQQLAVGEARRPRRDRRCPRGGPGALVLERRGRPRSAAAAAGAAAATAARPRSGRSQLLQPGAVRVVRAEHQLAAHAVRPPENAERQVGRPACGPSVTGHVPGPATRGSRGSRGGASWPTRPTARCAAPWRCGPGGRSPGRDRTRRPSARSTSASGSSISCTSTSSGCSTSERARNRTSSRRGGALRPQRLLPRRPTGPRNPRSRGSRRLGCSRGRGATDLADQLADGLAGDGPDGEPVIERAASSLTSAGLRSGS